MLQNVTYPLVCNSVFCFVYLSLKISTMPAGAMQILACFMEVSKQGYFLFTYEAANSHNVPQAVNTQAETSMCIDFLQFYEDAFGKKLTALIFVKYYGLFDDRSADELGALHVASLLWQWLCHCSMYGMPSTFMII